MKRSTCVSVPVLLAFFGLIAARGMAEEPKNGAPAKKLHVAVVTGGHPFEKEEFLKLFQGHGDVTYKHLPQKTGGEIFDDISHWPYDVLVLYNFNQTITPAEQKNFLKLLDQGVGLVILHHANAAYKNWPLYAKIAGVQYHFRPWEKDGVKMDPSGYHLNTKFKVHVADANHPVTRGLKDYDFVDETYDRVSVDPGVHALLTTDEPTSEKTIGWTKTYAKSKVCYLQSGHDHVAYGNPNYRTLVVRAIRWTGRTPGRSVTLWRAIAPAER
jgi:uncharacterized protein